MQHFTLDAPTPARHARLFELIRQQNRASCIATRLKSTPLPAPGALAEVANRAAASWQNIC